MNYTIYLVKGQKQKGRQRYFRKKMTSRKNKDMREITHITGGELKPYGSSLRQSTLCFLATLIAVSACQQSVSAHSALPDNVTSLTKTGTKEKRVPLFVNETDCRKGICQNERR